MAALHSYYILCKCEGLPAAKTVWMGSGSGSVGRAISFDTGGPRFEPYHRQTYLLICLNRIYLSVNCTEKTKMLKKGRERSVLKTVGTF